MKRLISASLALLLCLSGTGLTARASSDSSTIQAPTLMYSGVGGYLGQSGKPIWCQESYHSSPAVVDLDGDGALEIVCASYSTFCVDAKTGTLKWRAPSGHDSSTPDTSENLNYEGRIWSDVVVDDIDADGAKEIIVGSAKGTLAVYDANGRFKPGWPQKTVAPGTSQTLEIMSVRVSDLDLDGTKEIVAAVGQFDFESPVNVWVFEHDGSVRAGWPQYVKGSTDAGFAQSSYAWGVYSDALAVDDMDGDGYPEIYVPSDVPNICAYDANGRAIPANPEVFGENVPWGGVGVFMSAEYETTMENEGWWGYSADGYTRNKWLLSARSTGERYTADFTFCGPVIDDLDGDGTKEMAVVGRVYDWANGYPLKPYASLFQTLLIFNADRTRFVSADGVVWDDTPISGAPLSEKWEDLPVCSAEVTAADLDGDGKKELIYPTYDGKLNCTWLDKTQKYSWPINVYDGKTKEFATTPAVQDLDGDGRPELIFGTYTENVKGGKKGSLCIANYKGEVIQKVTLVDGLEGDLVTANSCINAPVVADIDGDGVYEVVFMGHQSALTVYKLPAQKAGGVQGAAPANVSVPLNTSWKAPTAAKKEQDSAGTQPYMTWLFHNYQPDDYVLYPCGNMRARTYNARYALIDPTRSANSEAPQISGEYFSWIDVSPTRAVVVRRDAGTDWKPWYGLLDLTTGEELRAPTATSCTWNGRSLEEYTAVVTAVSLDDGQGGTLVFDGVSVPVTGGGDPHRGLIPLEENGKKGYMSASGGVLVPAEYDELTVAGSQNQYFLAKKDGKYGVFDHEGTVVFPFLFNKVFMVPGSDLIYARYGTDFVGVAQPEDYAMWSMFAGQTVNMGPAAGHELVHPVDNNIVFNGQPTTLKAYLFYENTEGGGANYVKLRDVALLLSGTGARFDVTWDPETGITMLTGRPYTVAGSEGVLAGGEEPRPYIYNLDAINVDGESVLLKAYTIDESNFFKLRDLAEVFGFTVGWTMEDGITVNTP